jgi:dienelactone hydrolase
MVEAPDWDLARLSRTPEIFDAPELSSPGLRALFYEGMPHQGRPTRNFAWLGLPHEARERPVPAVVVVHGGCGTAFASWARLWLQRGYAVIAMDTCGATPVQGLEDKYCDSWPRHAWAGASGWGDSFKQLDQPIEDQWPYQVVGNVMLAHSLLASFPEVDKSKIALTGVSWGGTLAALLAGVDPRLACVAPVYGCGYDPAIFTYFAGEQAPAVRARWLDLYNPLNFLPNATMPLLWLTGTNDRGCPLDHLSRSIRLAAGPSTLSARLRMVHGHGGVSERAPEIWDFFEAKLKGKKPLLRVREGGQEKSDAWLSYEAHTDVAQAELVYTTDSGIWPDRLWHTSPASMDRSREYVSATLPTGTTAYFFNVEDYRGSVVSSLPVDLAPAMAPGAPASSDGARS